MALVEELSLAHVPPSIALFGALYKDVTNAAFLREQLLAGNSDFEYAFIDATTILSTTHILAAAFRAVNDLLNDRLRTRNVHSEIVFSLSPNNNISTSFINHGVSPTTSSLLVLKVSTLEHPTTRAALTSHITANVQGTPMPFSDASLAHITDITRVRKLYKLGSGKDLKGKVGKKKGMVVEGSGVEQAGLGDRGDRGEMEVMVLGIMALKGS